MDLDRAAVLNALLMCDEAKPFDAQKGIGGPIYAYVNLGEDGGFIRHPGLENGNYSVRVQADVSWLMDKGYIQIRTWGDDGRSFTFELTDKARNETGRGPGVS